MDVSVRRFTAILALVAIISISGTLATQSLFSVPEAPKLKGKNIVTLICERAQGHDVFTSTNIITDIGEHYARDMLGFNNVTNHNETKWISLGNSSILQTRTILGVEATTAGATRALATGTAHYLGSDYTANFTVTFHFTGTISFNATGLHWNDTPNSDSNLFALVSVTALTWINHDNCTVIWSTIYDFN